MYDRLPTPFGLVRGGVAPDHPKIKSVTRVYDKIAAHPEFRFYGNVEMGRDLTHEDLSAYYHAIIYAVGARTDRRMGIPREHLPGSHSATEFVGWYNAHPDFRHLSFDLSAERVAVVGNGNVAMDLARILASPREVLAADRHRRARARGPGRGRDPRDPRPRPARPGPGRLHQQGAQGARRARRRRRDRRPGRTRARRPHRDARLPVARAHPRSQPRDPARVRGPDSDRRPDPDRPALPGLAGGDPRTRPGRGRSRSSTTSSTRARTAASVPARPGGTTTLPVGLVFRAIGYQGVPLPGHPLRRDGRGDPQRRRGASSTPAPASPIEGEYVVGWIKRGPRGIIGTNKPDSQETVQMLLADLAAGNLHKEDVPAREVLERLLGERRRDFVSYEDWQLIDLLEQERGRGLGRPTAAQVQPRRGDAPRAPGAKARRRGGRPATPRRRSPGGRRPCCAGPGRARPSGWPPPAPRGWRAGRGRPPRRARCSRP